jgi:hypothetical protein
MKRPTMLYVLLFTLIPFNSCQKNDDSDISDEIALSQEETQVDEILSDVDLIVDEAITAGESDNGSLNTDSTSYLTDCPTITIDKDKKNKVMTIDFGQSCTGKDGKVRSGKIIVTSEFLTRLSSAKNKAFENYFVDQKKIEGSVITNIVKDTTNNTVTSEIQEDITITFPENGVTAHRTSDMTRQKKRNVVSDKTDDQIVSWGNIECTRVSGVKVTKTIDETSPLVYNVACHHIVSGIVSFTTSDNKSWTIDYGNGDCDDKATLTKNGKTKEITIK